MGSTRMLCVVECTDAGSAFHYAVTSTGRGPPARAAAAPIPPTPSIVTIGTARIHLNTSCTFTMQHVLQFIIVIVICCCCGHFSERIH